ncbi:hypothetical protein B0T22DRAFT_81381 [Podospora appendiculata]|uniref:Uncharacterized protein n=1 Tax=Podospora appendiculata TaxID=314037 RepID=A0AAE0XJT1_9PEZI|nr:hypothetical protein B0T22DRAFT_81381 [Podospora appendiculata]
MSASPQSQSSPKKQDQEPFTDQQPESQNLPAQRSEQTRTIPVRSASVDRMADALNSYPKPQGSRTQVRTPEPRTSKERMNGHKELAERSPSTPGHLPHFDWDEFETRYEEALARGNRHEQELLEEFETLVRYFNVWASAASVHDTERGVKRLQTRERYVKIAEQSLLQKKKHLTEVVRAFQSALALLSQS